MKDALISILVGALLIGSFVVVGLVIYYLPMVAFIIFVICACWGIGHSLRYD
jgi:hypothetical protein